MNPSPQTEDGHLDVANELVEQFAKHNIPGTEMRILWTIWRKTWCWKDGDRKKDFDWISISQFEEMTGMKRANVHRHLRSLLSKRIILVIQKDNGKLYYGFNKRYNEWLLSKRITLSKRIRPVIQKDTQLLSKRINTKDSITKDTYTKDNNTPFAILEFFNYSTGKEFRLTADKKGQVRARLKSFSLEDMKQAILNRLDDPNSMGKNKDNKMWAHDWDSLFRNDANMDRALNLAGSTVKDNDFYVSEMSKIGIVRFSEKYGKKLAMKYSNHSKL